MSEDPSPAVPELVVRRATREDVEALVPFARQAFRDAYRLLDEPQDIEDYVLRHFTLASFGALLEDARSTLLVATAAGQLTGYAHVACTAAPACVAGPRPIELARIYLRHDVVGRGYGAVLMNAVFAEARRRRCRTIWLGVYDRNVRAREFYRRWGFVDVGTKEFLFGGRSYADPVMAAAVGAGARRSVTRTGR